MEIEAFRVAALALQDVGRNRYMHAGLIEETSRSLDLNKRRVDSSVLRLVAFALGTPRGSAVVCRVFGWWHKKKRLEVEVHIIGLDYCTYL